MTSEGFLSRWSRKKVEAQEPKKKTLAPRSAAPEEYSHQIVESQPEPEAQLPVDGPEEIKEPTAEELGLPPIEELSADSDYTVFLKEGVPELLKKQALRALWRSDPVLANLDGMNEYDEDFSKFTPLAEGVAEELKKLMKENSKQSEPEVQEPVEETEEELINQEPLDETVDQSENPTESDDNIGNTTSQEFEKDA